MPEYTVIIRYDASQATDVEADTAEEAANKVAQECGVSICHQCSRELEVGDPIGVQVLDEHGELVLSEDW